MPVQVTDVTDEELRNANDWDWDNELRQLVAQLRCKLLCLRKDNIIDGSMYGKLQHLQGKVLFMSYYV